MNLSKKCCFQGSILNVKVRDKRIRRVLEASELPLINRRFIRDLRFTNVEGDVWKRQLLR